MDHWSHEAEQLRAAGLPSDFWQKLEPAVLLYEKDIEVLKSIGEPFSGDGGGIVPTLCRDRAEALAKAREIFGPALDRFMYGHVVKGMAIYFDRVESAPVLRSREAGCR